MSASEAQIRANRANSLKSTGPRTPEGKARCRANALKHGLCSAVVVPEDLELVRARELDWYHALRPQNTAQAWLVEKVALYSVRIDRCERMERRLRDRKSLLSEVAWEDDHRLEAEALGGKIRSRPALVAEELRRTPAGCDWLIGRWAMLESSVAAVGPWGPDQVALAFDLLGTPPEFRDGRAPAGVDDQVGLARREAAALLGRREAASHVDEVDRALTEADLFDESHAELKRLRRYESALHGRLRWAMSQLKYESPHLRPHPDLRPRQASEFAGEPESKGPGAPAEAPAKLAASGDPKGKGWPRPFEFRMARAEHPPFCLEPHEIPADGSAPDIKAIAVNRELRRLGKQEARRQARRRRLERRRA